MEFRRNLEEIRAQSEEREPTMFYAESAKSRINEVLFEIMPPTTTLREMEDLALAIFQTVEAAWGMRV